ncbi:DUF2637 domain-containing protein [Streptomyces pinistramenti]|uniref:DUF2637 domain-containing protein n=1 Tax=Streptomyces pinistramenti TaxID=2884812 RepID=UPI001D096332|nr:DUF2637 domain-containing protein [Streptomyces pinistramenti]MCB5905956.1 DUF2637 domain-containing protein [Streptomyces pinistramenti]
MHETQTFIPAQQTDGHLRNGDAFPHSVRDAGPQVGMPLFAPQAEPYGFGRVPWESVPGWDGEGLAVQQEPFAAPYPPVPEAGPVVPHPRSRRHRPGIHRADRTRIRAWARMLSSTAAALTAVLISVLGAMVCYTPLRALASEGVPGGLAALWPLLIYGPWTVASLSILRASANRRRVRHSWCVVILLSAVAVVLCIAHARLTLPAVSVAGLPPITVLLSFHQLVRQIEPQGPGEPTTAKESGTGSHRKPGGE